MTILFTDHVRTLNCVLAALIQRFIHGEKSGLRGVKREITEIVSSTARDGDLNRADTMLLDRIEGDMYATPTRGGMDNTRAMLHLIREFRDLVSRLSLRTA